MGDAADDRTQRTILGIGLLALGLFVLLSLVPVDLLGEGLAALFPSGNVVGPVGGLIAGGLAGVFGVSAVIGSALLGVWGAWSIAWLDHHRGMRWTSWLAAALLIVPAFAASLAGAIGDGAARAAGDYGRWAGAHLTSALGWLGSALLLAFLFTTATILTLGLGPFHALSRGFRAARDGGGSTLQAGAAAAGAIEVGWLRFRRGADRLLTAVIDWVQRGEPPGATEVAPPIDPGGGTQPRRAVKEKRGRKGGRNRDGRQMDLWATQSGDNGDLPPIELLTSPPRQRYTVSEGALDELGEILVRTLSTFRVEGRIAGRTTGPVVTQFEVVPASGVKVGKIAALADDLALGLKAPSIRIVAPIPGKGAVGVEVPNPHRKIVYIREILESEAYRTSRSQLPLALGEDVTGKALVADLAQMPHLLIAGVTGSGKSVCINAVISSLVYRYAPEQLRLLLIDPKMVELGGYNVLPHLRHPVVTDNDDAATVLRWLVYEMERRYEWLSANGCRNLREYNRRVSRGAMVTAPQSQGGGEIAEPDLLPYVVLVIDELADLMMTVQSEVERPLAYLAQKARATGIHLVVATQRPSVNVITGLIKANFPCRIAFRVASKVDSRTIIDQNGAETLLGNGDMLFMPPGQAEPVRIQGTFVSTEDTERLMEWYRARAEEERQAAEREEEDILEVVHQRELEEAEAEVGQEVLEDRDPLFRKAAEVVVQHQQGSTSLLQRRLKIGYGRAARIVDQLEHAGIVGPPEGSKPREVLVSLQDLNRICSEV